MSSLTNKSFNGLDLFKFIMAVFVVTIHSFPWGDYGNSKSVEALDLLTKIAVPFFFFASGYLLACKFNYPFSDESNLAITTKRIKQMIKMYLFWTAVYLPLGIYSYIQEQYSVPYSILITIRKIIFRGENFNSWMLWYLLSTIYALVFVLVTIKLKFKPNYYIVSSAVIIVVGKFVNYLAWSEQQFPAALEAMKSVIKYTITDGRVLNGLIYLPLGIWIFYNKNIVHYAKFLVLPSFIVSLFVNNSAVDTVSNILLYMGVFCFALELELKDKPVYKILRSSSTTTYFIHMYVNTAICFILYGEMKATWTEYLLTVVVTVLISVIYAVFKHKKIGLQKA